MEKYKSPFFGPEGLTSTSANHIANIAKEYYQSIETELKSMSFIEESMSIIGNLNKTIVKTGTPNILTNIDSYITDIIEAKSLIAWLREGIKLKDKLYSNTQNYVSKELEELKAPSLSDDELTDDDVLNSLDVKDRERYLTNETICAVIGSLIHPNGEFSKAKQDMFNKISNPIKTSINGRDTIITYYNPIFEKPEVESKFFELQKTHRSAQAELNSLKSKINKIINDFNDNLSKKYIEECEQYRTKKQELIEKDKLYISEELKKIDSLKIVIPQHLRSFYEKINNN
jgi:hypothetical protein